MKSKHKHIYQCGIIHIYEVHPTKQVTSKQTQKISYKEEPVLDPYQSCSTQLASLQFPIPQVTETSTLNVTKENKFNEPVSFTNQ